MKEITKDYYSYDGIIDTFEVETLFSEYDDDYQGDAYYLLKDGDRHGILIFGWGSCSGCDWLESAYDDVAELTNLRDSLWDNVKWFDSKPELRKYVQEKDFSLEYYSYGTGGPRFVERLKEYVS